MFNYHKSLFVTYPQDLYENIFSVISVIVMYVCSCVLPFERVVHVFRKHLKEMFVLFKKWNNSIIPSDASNGRMSRQHRCSEESRGRADRRRGWNARTHQPRQHRRSRKRSVTHTHTHTYRVLLYRQTTSSCKFCASCAELIRSIPSRRDRALGADPGSVSEWEAQAQAEPAAVAAADLRSADHEGLAGSIWGWTQPAARARTQHQHTHHPAEDQEAQGLNSSGFQEFDILKLTVFSKEVLADKLFYILL